MTDNPIRRIVILGNGVAAWLAALVLSKIVPRPCLVSVVDEPRNAGMNPLWEVGESSLAPIKFLHRLIGIDERDFMRSTHATFKLGTEYVGWGNSGGSFFQPFGTLGAPLDGIAFHHHWLRAQLAGDLSQYSLCAVAARLGRFMHPSDDPRSVLSTLDYGYHFDAQLYRDFLRARAEEQGVMRVAENVASVQLRADGLIEALLLDGAERQEADLFIDASAEATLIQGALATGYEDWSGLLPCDRMIAIHCTSAAEPKPMTICTARENGWEWHAPLQGHASRGYTYCSRYSSDEQAYSALSSRLETTARGEPLYFQYVNGRRTKAWNRNCIAIGSAAGFIDPLAATQLHLLQSGLAKLVRLFPTRDRMTRESEEYNRLLAEEYEHLRDSVAVHYYLSADRSGAFWQSFQHVDLSSSLHHKLRVFRSRGRVVLYDGETFEESNWANALLSEGLSPMHADALAQTLPIEQVQRQLGRMRAAIAQAAETMPAQAKIIQQHCAANLSSQKSTQP
jgi:tryptophan 7-halogenase